jgi:hypothetical protein
VLRLALIFFGAGFLVFGMNARAAESAPAKNYWKTYFTKIEADAVKKNAEKYVLSEIKKKSDDWKGVFSSFHLKKGSIDDQAVKDGGLGTSKIRGLDDLIQEKIIASNNSQSGNVSVNQVDGLVALLAGKLSPSGGALSGILNWASNQTFSADNLTGAFAALDGSKITGLQTGQISGLDSSLSGKLSTTGGALGGILNWATGQTFIADNLTGAYAALDGSKITGLTAGQVGAIPYSGATGAIDLNGKNLVNLGNVGIGTTAAGAKLDVRGNAIVSGAVASDVPPAATMLMGQSAWSQSTTNTTGAALKLAGGVGRRFYTIVDYSSTGGKIFQTAVNGTSIALTEGTSFQCVSAGSNSACAVNLATAINGNATLGPLVSATQFGANVYLEKKDSAGLLSLTVYTNNVAGAATATSGTDGGVQIAGSVGVPELTVTGTLFQTNPILKTVMGVAQTGHLFEGYTPSGTKFFDIADDGRIIIGLVSPDKGGTFPFQAKAASGNKMTGIYLESPDSTDHVMLKYDGYSVPGTYFGWLASDGDMRVSGANAVKFATYTSGAYYDRMYISNAGNVGIGTTSPAATLDVNGEVKLKKESAQPYACDATHDGTIALTSGYRTCVCKGGSTTWVFTSDGTTTCTW